MCVSIVESSLKRKRYIDDIKNIIKKINIAVSKMPLMHSKMKFFFSQITFYHLFEKF